MNPLPAHMLAEFRGIVTSFRHLVTGEPESAPQDNPFLLLDTEIMQCTLCPDGEAGRFPVSVTAMNPGVVFVVNLEGGRAETDPYSDEAGELLRRMFAAIDIPRERLHMTHLIKCHRPGSPIPANEAAARCRPFLEREIGLTAPVLICCLGKETADALNGGPSGQEPGTFFNFMNIPAVTLPSPTHILSRPEEKRPAWEILQRIRERLAADGTANAGS